jgi:hypothetical protein
MKGLLADVRVAKIPEEALRHIDPSLAFLRNVNVPGDLAPP